MQAIQPPPPASSVGSAQPAASQPCAPRPWYADPGEADIIAIAPGDTLRPGEVDLTSATRVPATVTVTVDCLHTER
ncbi:hypothetical protein GCM10020360_06120 [Nonlabens tegetincola]